MSKDKSNNQNDKSNENNTANDIINCAAEAA